MTGEYTRINGEGEWKEYRRLVLRELERLDKTLRNLASDVEGVRGDVIAIKEQVSTIKSSVEQIKEIFEKVDDRIGGVEREQSAMKARASVLGLVAGGGAVGAAEIIRAIFFGS